MAINEEARQLEIATELEELARTLAHSTRDLPHPDDSYGMLGELSLIIGHLAQVSNQLGKWHGRAVGGKHYANSDWVPGDGGPQASAKELKTAATLLKLAAEHAELAQSHNSAVRWQQEPQKPHQR